MTVFRIPAYSMQPSRSLLPPALLQLTVQEQHHFNSHCMLHAFGQGRSSRTHLETNCFRPVIFQDESLTKLFVRLRQLGFRHDRTKGGGNPHLYSIDESDEM